GTWGPQTRWPDSIHWPRSTPPPAPRRATAGLPLRTVPGAALAVAGTMLLGSDAAPRPPASTVSAWASVLDVPGLDLPELGLAGLDAPGLAAAALLGMALLGVGVRSARDGAGVLASLLRTIVAVGI